MELPELLPRLPPELYQEMGSIPGLTGGRYDRYPCVLLVCGVNCQHLFLFTFLSAKHFVSWLKMLVGIDGFQIRLKAGAVQPART